MNEAEFNAALAEEAPRVCAALRRIHPGAAVGSEQLECAAQESSGKPGADLFSWLLALAEKLHLRHLRARQPRFRQRCLALVVQALGEERETIVAICRRLRVDGEDVAQEAYLRAERYIGETEKLEQLPGTLEDARRWVLRVARNLGLDRRRAGDRSRTIPLVANPPAVPVQPEDERLPMLRICLEHLPADERKVIGVFLEGNKPATIAKVLGSSVKTVYYLLRRAKERLERCLAAAGVGDLP